MRAARSCACCPRGSSPRSAASRAPTAPRSASSPTARPALTIVICASDNLGKGAAGQAIQNANLALGLPETAGLRLGERARLMSVTAAKGFVASGVAAGIRRRDRKDLAVVRSVPHAVGRGDVHAQPRAGRLPAA